MALDPRFVLAYPFADYFVDKDTGLPLANGQLTFYIDDNRTVLKNIYTLSGAPPYSTDSYVPLPNPLTLSANGNPMDNNGNLVDIYFFPFEGLPSDNNDNPELYYLTVTSSALVPQFTRSAIPNVTEESIEVAEILENYIPNPQFVSHNSAQSNGSLGNGQLTQLITPIAPGGWTFERPSNNTSDFVTFYRFSTPITPPPTGNPRYAVDINLTVATPTVPFKDLRLKFPSVNMFQTSTNYFTIYFEAISVNNNTIPMDIYLIRNFGTGGSANPPKQFLGSVEITGTFNSFNVPFIPGVNSSSSFVGPDDDDYIQFSFSFPTNTSLRCRMTNFVLTNGNIVLTSFPFTTNAQSLAPTQAGNSTPDYTGYDLGLPVIQGINGYIADHSEVGKIYPISYDTNNIAFNEVLCDGSMYITKNYTNGIPNARLQSKLISPFSNNLPVFGTGLQFVTAFSNNLNPSEFSFSTNQPGNQTATSDGGTGFAFYNVSTGASNSYGITTYSNPSPSNHTLMTCVANSVGAAANIPEDFGTGITILSIRNQQYSYQVFTLNFNTINISTLAGKYFTFQTTPANSFYVWYKVGGVGADPAPGGTGILVNLPATPLDPFLIGYATNSAMNASTFTNVRISVAPPASSYFTFYSNLIQYYCFYIVNGVGTDPALPSATAIPVNISSTNTLAEITAFTCAAINAYSFSVPDLRGLFIRGLDNTGIWDFSPNNRMLRAPFAPNTSIGSLELDNIIQHQHAIPVADTLSTGGEVGIFTAAAPGVWDQLLYSRTNYTFPGKMSTNSPGITTQIPSADINDYLLINNGETVPVNMALNYVIKL